MKIKDILSNDEIFELQKNQGKSTDEILQIARDRYKEQLASGEIARKEQAKLEYQKRNDLNAIKELNALKKEAIDKGASGAEIEQLQNNYNIMRYGTPEQKKQLEQAQNAVKIKQEIIDEAARNDEKYGGFSGGASRNLQKAWGNTLVGIGETAKYLGIDSERLNRGADYYKNAVEYLNNIDKSRQKQGLKTFSEHAGNFVGATLGPVEVATLPFGFGKTALRTAGKFAGIELLGGTPRRIGESVTEPNSNLGFLEKSALESGLAGGFGGLLHGGYNLYKGLKGAKGAGRAETAPNGGVSGTTTPQNSNADDLATNGSWLGDGSTPSPNGGLVRGDNFVTDPNSANVEQNIVANFELSPNVRDLTKISTDEISADLSHLSEKHPEMFEKASDVFKLIKEIKDEPQFFYRNNRLDGALIAKRLQEQGKIGKVVVNKENGEVIHATKAREQDLARLERVANKNDERVRALSAVSSRKVEQGGGLPSETIPQHPLNTADDIIDLVPDENGVFQVVYNGSSKELAKIATEIAKGEIQSMGAKRLVFIADNIAEAAAKDAEQKISANIAKIDDDSVELYANNTALLTEIAKKYPMLNKDEQIELANKQILANASAELLEYSKFLNGGSLPNDARLLGKNAGRMILKSLNAGASKQEIIDMLLKAGISGRNSTAAKALIQTGDINAYNAQMRGGEAELIAELSQNVRVATKNESIGAILGSAKEKAIKNDELLKKGVGNQGLDDVINTFKSSKNGKEFEVAENGFGRELLSYDGVAANEEMKRAFLAWEAQEKKADITLNDGRKVVFLEPDEAVQLSYGNSYLYGEKDLEALFARRRAESLEQKLKRLQSHPAYENLLKMRENTKASELKGDTVGGSKPTVFYEPQSERYLRTQGGGGLPNAERSITITKADVAKLRADKANEALATKLENNLEALTGDAAASGLIDDLLTRDYHLASAAKKRELVAPKNADEVAKSADEVAKSTVKITKAELQQQIDELEKLYHSKYYGEWAKATAGEQKAKLSLAQKAINKANNEEQKLLAKKQTPSVKAKLNDVREIKAELEKQANTLKKEISNAKKTQDEIENELENINKKRMELIKQRDSLESSNAGMKAGFSTQALNELMLGLGSGGANAMAEDDPNKKAQAFIKGFLAGFGGAKAASMLAKNAQKLAPQLARASEKMASDFPRLLNDRPDILGGVLGRMNNAKDKFSFIFGGEKALGANKAKLEKAKDMAKNGAKDDEIWAKTGWYKDIDGKWKFEINAEGGKLKELNAPELDEATKIIKRDYFDKQMNLKELEDFIQFKNGYIDFDAIKKFYDLPKDMSKGELTQKFPYFKMSVNDYMEHGFYKDIDLLHDEIMPARKILNQEYSKTPLNEVLDDPQLFASYPQLKDVKVSVDELKSTEQAHFNPNKNEIVLNSHLDAEDMKSSLYHEIQHKIQAIEGFGAGGNTQKLSYQEYKNLAGESEARNVQKRLNRTYSKDDAIDGEFNRLLIKDMDNPKWQELKQKRRELILAGKLDEADKIKKQLDQRQEFLKREAVKNVKEFSSYSPHPFNTLDINPNDRIVKYDSGMSASMELEKDLLTSQGRVNTNALLKNASKMPKALSRDEFEAQFNANISGDSYVKTPIGDIKVNVEKAWEHFKKNTYNQDRSDLSGAFIHTLQDPLFIVKQNWKPTASPHTMGQSIAKSQNAKRLMDDRQQEIITQSTIFFKPFSDENGGKYLASFAIDKNGELIQKTFYDIDSLEKIKKMIRTPENNVLYYKNARNQTMGYKDAEAGMRESFSPELKASYDMRDKLLKSTNEVRASLSKKGKAELEKLAGSKDSKLSRDAQIMKTLENAKSNPARYERLKKLYLDENGKVKDSIGLC
ncbi:MAG: hypothetical protein MR964_06080 [Campylobacter sp.]|uniref:LPD23 domain-containing protein n=1 Tax=Campylobacter sp. TaxID=205 RepID=UPI002AA705CB|nr:LPD23 domain-containing protein [Campylobacter sp.]MCI7023770.1 hypothetical protein [Campylobacter sp.]